jgi:rhodanese-related sulfurtransferase
MSEQEEPFEIDAVALKSRLDAGEALTVLDVREPWEAEIVSLDGSLLISLADLPRRVAEVPRDRPVAVMCHHGGRSAQATAWLRAQGFARTINIVGGIDAWARMVDPDLPRY